MLVGAEEIKNETGFDIARLYNITGRPLERWIERQENIILNFIRSHCYYGKQQLEMYLSLDNLKSVIKQAVIEQIDYVCTTKNDASKINAVSARAGSYSALAKERVTAYVIAPQAEEILRSHGLLYLGADVFGGGF